MTELDYIGGDELVFNNNKELGIHSGGFSVKSIMMKAGMSPIMTLNMKQSGGTNTNNVSDLFDNLVIPNWALTYNDKIIGGQHKDKDIKHNNSDSDSDDVIDNDLHDKLLDLVREHNLKPNEPKIKMTKKYKNKNKEKKNTIKKRR
jgi:hypothetical protein